MSSRVAFYFSALAIISTHTMIFPVKGQPTVRDWDNGDPQNSIAAELNIEAIRLLNEQVRSMRELLTESLQEIKNQQDTVVASLQAGFRLLLDHDVYIKNQTQNSWELAMEIRMELRVPLVLPTLNNWIVLMQRFDGSLNFTRNWIEYRNGFGEIGRGEFWLGNEIVHRLTNTCAYTLHIEVQYTPGRWFYADYATFSLDSEDNKYPIRVSGFSGDAGDSLTGIYSKNTWYQGGMSFSTWDNDNDRNSTRNCAQAYEGGWWFNSCFYSCLTCSYNDTFRWISLSRESEGLGQIRAARMSIKSRPM